MAASKHREWLLSSSQCVCFVPHLCFGRGCFCRKWVKSWVSLTQLFLSMFSGDYHAGWKTSCFSQPKMWTENELRSHWLQDKQKPLNWDWPQCCRMTITGWILPEMQWRQELKLPTFLWGSESNSYSVLSATVRVVTNIFPYIGTRGNNQKNSQQAIYKDIMQCTLICFWWVGLAISKTMRD